MRIDCLDILRGLLCAPLEISLISEGHFCRGRKMEDEVVVTHRFLLIKDGEMDYTLEGERSRLRSDVCFFVPAWCRREWRIPQGAEDCHLLWCEFSSGAVDVPPCLYWQRYGDANQRAAEFEILVQHKNLLQDRAMALRAEGQLKAMLARFWTGAQVIGSNADKSVVCRHPVVVHAVAWLEQNFAQPDALEVFYRGLELSPNHFRLLFKRQCGETVQSMLMRLRLRRARYLVRETTQPLKWVAAESGFTDPLYFSRQYRKFWGRAATVDRGGRGVA